MQVKKKYFYYKGIRTKYIICSDGRIFSTKTNKYLSPELTKNKYLRVNLHVLDGKHEKPIQKKFSVHRLVASAFLKQTKNKTQVNHIDGNKSNNSIENLEWVTPHENICHAYKIGLINRRFSEKSPNHKLTEKQVRKVCELLEEHPNLSLKAIAEIVGCNDANVESIKYRKAWKSVSKNYKFHSSRKYKA